MNLLYFGKYKSRFKGITGQLKELPANSRILELCFADTHIAEYSKRAGYQWKGLDLNKHFVDRATKLGYEAYQVDLTNVEAFPKADLCIMMGSLYLFHPHTTSLLRKIFEATNSIIISEPVSNLSSKKGLIGYFAKRAANAGKGDEKFRYNQISLLAMLESNCALLDCNISSTLSQGKDFIVTLTKNGNNRH